MSTVAVLEFERARDAFIVAARAAGEARVLEMKYEAERHVAKMRAVKTLLTLANPLTEKAFTVTAAEAYVETDESYASYLTEMRGAHLLRVTAEAERDAARCNMHVASALICGGPR